MANLILVVLSLSGTPSSLEGFRGEALSAESEGWALSCGTPGKSVYAGANAMWVSRGPQQATLSFLARWQPPQDALDSLGKMATRHGVVVTRSLAAEEGWACVDGAWHSSYGDLWSGEGLMLATTQDVSPSDAHTYATCGFPVPADLMRIPLLKKAA